SVQIGEKIHGAKIRKVGKFNVPLRVGRGRIFWFFFPYMYVNDLRHNTLQNIKNPMYVCQNFFMKRIVLFSTLSLGLFFVACKKDKKDETKEKSKKELLKAGKWQAIEDI